MHTEIDNVDKVSSINHKSAVVNKDKVEMKIKEEISEGNYFKTDETDVLLAAIEKPDGSIRLIHDLSFPGGKSLNDYAKMDDCKYATVKELLPQLKPGYIYTYIFLANVISLPLFVQYRSRPLTWC